MLKYNSNELHQEFYKMRMRTSYLSFSISLVQPQVKSILDKETKLFELIPFSNLRFYLRLVGMTGFEPATPCSQDRYATKLRHMPII